MSDEELFEKWWKVHSPPGTFDKSQCKVAFIAGLVTQRVEAAQQSVQRTACPVCQDNRLDGEPCPVCERVG